MSDFGVTSMWDPLVRVAVRPPSRTGDYPGAHWAAPIDFDMLERQHRDFCTLLRTLGCDVIELDAQPRMPDSIFTYDPCFVFESGFVQFQAAKPFRQSEAETLAAELIDLGIPLVGRLTGAAVADGGDLFWLDRRTLAIGRSYRTNDDAIQQIRDLVGPAVTVETFDVPHDQGPEFCLHLLSVVSPIREDLAVVYPRLAPVRLLQALADRGITCVEVPEDDYLTLGCNVLAIEPGVVVIASGNDVTSARLRDHGVDVHMYQASEISKGEGGPTCLTRPILRAKNAILATGAPGES